MNDDISLKPVILRLRRARKALRLALMIIENDASVSYFNAPETYKCILRWCDELRVESGCDKPKNSKKYESNKLKHRECKEKHE